MNPDFRGADEVIVPDNLADMTGWNTGVLSVEQGLDEERRMTNALQEDLPFAFRYRANAPIATLLWEKWIQFQKDKGRFEGSQDWTLLDEFAVSEKLAWLPQKIGSCVWSNTFRAWVIRAMFQITFYNGEYIGRDEFGPNNFAPYGGFSYGMMRKRGNLRGGDGGFCAPMAESLLKDGVLPCNDPTLLTLLAKLNADGDKDFPEPQSNSVYRQFGDWKYLDDLKGGAKFPLLNSPDITSAEQLWDHIGECKPTFTCSGIAIKKVGTHPDGFAIHKRNPNSSWAHNMCQQGRLVASDGERFFRESNESWGDDIIYNLPYDEVDEWYRKRRVSSNAIGEIADLNAVVPVVNID